LEAESFCWACGGGRFATAGGAVVGEQTISLGEPGELTLGWDISPDPIQRDWRPYAGGVAGLACIMGLLGFLVGRATGAPAEVTEPGPTPPPAYAMPLPLPPQETLPPLFERADPVTPPAMGFGRAQPRYPMGDEPIVTIQPGGRRAPIRMAQAPDMVQAPTVPQQAAAPRVEPPVAAARPPAKVRDEAITALPPAPIMVVPERPVQPPPMQGQMPEMTPDRRPPPVVIRDEVVGTPPAPVSGRAPAGPEPTDNSGVVSLRNDAHTPIRIIIEGADNGAMEVSIAPGSVFPVSLRPGTYQFQAASARARSSDSSMTVAAKRRHALVVQRSHKNGSEVLSLLEPARPRN
jgi:hypothetical protein